MNGFKTLGEFPLKEGVARGTDSGSKSFGISLIICLLCLIMSKCSVYCGPTQSLDVGFHSSETSPQPPLCLVLASSYTVRIHCPLNPLPRLAPSSGVLAQSVQLFLHPKCCCKTPSFAYLMGKSLSNAVSEAQIPVNYRKSKCLCLQSQ